jgi:uncharacterized protein YbjT (DUF2867 family)
MRVLVTGATGQFAGLVVPALVSRGVGVRAFVHDPAKSGQAKGAGADEVAVGDLRDPASVPGSRWLEDFFAELAR